MNDRNSVNLSLLSGEALLASLFGLFLFTQPVARGGALKS